MKPRFSVLLLLGSACASNEPPPPPASIYPLHSCSEFAEPCREMDPANLGALLDLVNDDLTPGTTIVLGEGSFRFDNALTIRAAKISLIGQGIDHTILDFSLQAAQSNGVDVVGDDFQIADLTITDAKKDGLRIEDSTNVAIRRIKATWSGGPASTNGSYGIYPVRCTNVLIDQCEGWNAADSGIYVGQSINAIVRRSIARQNVAGIEIENTQFADVHDNVVEDNSAGLLVFDLPGNPIVGRDIHLYANTIRGNNRPNFAPSGVTVSGIPSGTGTLVMASRRVEIDHNTYADNGTGDIAILSGLALVSSTAAWALPIATLRGSNVGLELPSDGVVVLNFVSSQVWLHDNTHGGSGTAPDASDPMARPIGALLALLFGTAGTAVDPVLYDGIGEQVDANVPANNSNVNKICIGSGASFASLDLGRLMGMLAAGGTPVLADVYRPAPPFAPFDCRGVTIPALSLGFDR